MIQGLAKFYGTLLRGLVVLAVAGAISQGRFFEAEEAARKSVKQGLVSLSRLNQRISATATALAIHKPALKSDYRGGQVEE